MGLTTEAAIERYLCDKVKRKHGLAIKMHPYIAGMPDRLVLLDGRAIFVEVKKPDGRLSKRQLVMHERLGKLGFPVTTVWSVEGIDAFIASL